MDTKWVRVWGWWSAVLRVCLVRVCSCYCYFADVSKIVLKLLLFGAFPAFYCSSLGALLADMALFRVLRAFLEGFMGFVWVCVVLVLCVACVAFVRVNS